MSHLHDLAQAFKALSHPNRLQIYVDAVAGKSRCLGYRKRVQLWLNRLYEQLNIGAPTVSHHIKELVNAKLIRVERQGKFMTCYLNNDMRAQLEAFFAQQK